MPTRTHSCFRALAALALLLVPSVGQAQQNVNPPRVPPEFLENVRRLEGDRLRVCISSEGVLAPFERDLAHELAAALLLDVHVFEIPAVRAPPILDYRFAANRTELFTLLNNTCQVMLGFLLSTSSFGDWMTVTRPYLTMGFTFATTDPNVTRLGDLPPGTRIGSRISSTADIRFADFNLARPTAQQWRRIPYPNNQLIIDRLIEGELDAILIWEAGLLAGLDGDPEAAGVFRIAPAPFTPPAQLFGAVMLSRDTFLRTVLDQAIELLVDEGVIDELLADHGLPGRGAR